MIFFQILLRQENLVFYSEGKVYDLIYINDGQVERDLVYQLSLNLLDY